MIWQVILISIVIVAMELSRLLWHGICRKNRHLLLIHCGCAIALYVLSAQWTMPLALIALFATAASYIILDHDPRLDWWWRKRWAGQDAWHLLSMLSALPIQLAAAVAVTWPLRGDWATFVGVGVWWAILGLWTKFWLWRRLWLRPIWWSN